MEGLEGSGLGQDFNVCRPGQATLARTVFDIERGFTGLVDIEHDEVRSASGRA